MTGLRLRLYKYYNPIRKWPILFFFFKSKERRIVERWQNRKHQESTCLHRQQLHWKDLFDVTLLKLWGLLKACNLQRKAGIWNCGTFWPISTFIIVAATHSTSLSPSQAAAHMFQEQLRHSLWEPGWGGKKIHCLPGVRELCSEHWLVLLITEIQTKSEDTIFVVPSSLLQALTPFSWSDFQGI